MSNERWYVGAMMKVYLLVAEEYYSGYIVYAVSKSPISFVGGIHLPYGSFPHGINCGTVRKKISSVEVDETDVLCQKKDPEWGFGWEVVPATIEKDETKYEYKAVRELFGREE